MNEILALTNTTLLGVGTIFALMGIVTSIFPPNKINNLYGYRTASSMQSQTKWDFAQKYSSKVMTIVGIVLILISFTKNYLPFSESQHSIFSIALMIISGIIMFITIEKRLQKVS